MSNFQRVTKVKDFYSDDSDSENESCFNWSNKSDIKSEFWSWMPNQNAFLEKMRESNIHGIKYIGGRDQCLLERLCWSISVLAGIGYSIFLIIYVVVEPLRANPVVISFEGKEKTIDKIPFPSVTICNTNRIKNDSYWKIIDIILKLQYQLNSTDERIHATFWNHAKAYGLIDSFCATTKSFSDVVTGHTYDDVFPSFYFEGVNDTKMFRTIAGIVYPVYHQCSDMILRCRWNGKEINCSQLFYNVQTEFGICCGFNAIPWWVSNKNAKNQHPHPFQEMSNLEKEAWRTWDIDDDMISKEGRVKKVVPKRQSKAGYQSGLSFLINQEERETSSSCRSQESPGFRIQVHSPIDNPQVYSFGKTVKARTETFVNIKGEVTVPDDTLEDMPIHKRDCYFMGEFDLAAFKFYTQKNCFDECVMNATLELCECVRFNMPRLNNAMLCHSRNHSRCYKKIEKTLAVKGMSKFCRQCLPSCTQVEYQADTTRLPMRDDVDLWKSSDGVHNPWGNETLAIVHVFFSNEIVESKIRKSLYGVVDIIANCGGFLGLTLGISMISLVEPLYMLFLNCYRKCKSIFERKREDEVTVFSPSKVLVNPLDFVKWSDAYLKESRFRQRNIIPNLYR